MTTALRTRTAAKRPIGGVRSTPTATYSGPLWYFRTADGGVVCGRDDQTGKLICTCAAWRRSGWRCRHVASVVLNKRRDGLFVLPDRGADEIQVRFVWLLTLLGMDQPTHPISDATVTLKRMAAHERRSNAR